MIGEPGWSFFLSDLILRWEAKAFETWKKTPPTDESAISQLQIYAKSTDAINEWAEKLSERLLARHDELKEISEGEQEDTIYPN